MRLGFTILLLIVSMYACTNKNKVPSGIIPADRMDDLLWDVMKADEYIKDSLGQYSSPDVKKEKSRIFKQVFDLHNSSREEFTKSYQYYMGRPDLTKKILDTLAARGARQRAQLFRNTPF